MFVSFRNNIAGYFILNMLPLPTSLSTVMLPSLDAIMSLTIDKPRPIPLVFVVKNGSKILSIVSFFIPLPVSVKEISTKSPLSSESGVWSSEFRVGSSELGVRSSELNPGLEDLRATSDEQRATIMILIGPRFQYAASWGKNQME